METEKEITKEKKQVKATKVIGYILLTPSLISVLLFLVVLPNWNDPFFTAWTGNIVTWDQQTANGYTSALPLYVGLMALAGAYLIKDKIN